MSPTSNADLLNAYVDQLKHITNQKEKQKRSWGDETKTHERAKTKLTKPIIRKVNPIPNIGLSNKMRNFIPSGETRRVESHICQTVRILIPPYKCLLKKLPKQS